MNNSMINPSIVDLLKKVNSRYTLVTMTAKRKAACRRQRAFDGN